jgi:glycine/D-amino acid oxidase-like deaminating enzyme
MEPQNRGFNGNKQRLLSLWYSCSRLRATISPVTTEEVNKIWLDSNAVHLYQPGLGKDVVGGWWYPDDGQVDNWQLVTALQQAAANLGVEIRQGIEVHALQQKQGKVKSIYTSIGELEAKIYILATGSWAKSTITPSYPSRQRSNGGGKNAP